MKNIVKTIIALPILFCVSIYTANSETTTTYSETKTDDGAYVADSDPGTSTTYSVSKSTGTTNSGGNIPSKSTTYTTTTTTTSVSNLSDEQIISAIYSKFAKEQALIGTALNVSSQGGFVSINGTVTAQAQAEAAASAASSVKGVKGVRSYITVTTNPDFNKPAARAPNY
jgi:hyperosmotically inducible periplasmic protein